MQDHIAVVEQDPTTAAAHRSTAVEWTDLLFHLKLFPKCITNGIGLPFIVHRHNHKKIGDGGLLTYVEQQNIRRLFVLDNLYDPSSQVIAVQTGLLELTGVH
jgi:hypothetical protein